MRNVFINADGDRSLWAKRLSGADKNELCAVLYSDREGNRAGALLSILGDYDDYAPNLLLRGDIDEFEEVTDAVLKMGNVSVTVYMSSPDEFMAKQAAFSARLSKLAQTHEQKCKISLFLDCPEKLAARPAEMFTRLNTFGANIIFGVRGVGDISETLRIYYRLHAVMCPRLVNPPCAIKINATGKYDFCGNRINEYIKDGFTVKLLTDNGDSVDSVDSADSGRILESGRMLFLINTRDAAALAKYNK